MKKHLNIILSVFFILALAIPRLAAQEGEAEPGARRQRRGGAEGGGPRPMMMMREAFETADTDGNMIIDEAEAGALADKLISSIKEQLAAVRKRADRDGDGVLSPEELEAAGKVRARRREALQNMRQERARQRPGKRDGEAGPGDRQGEHQNAELPEFDKDGDFQISPDEEQALREHILGRVQQRNQHILERFDVNKNGVLDADEIAKAKEMHQKMRERMQQRQGERQGQRPGAGQAGDQAGKQRGRARDGQPRQRNKEAELPR